MQFSAFKIQLENKNNLFNENGVKQAPEICDVG